MSPETRPRILLIDDDRDSRELYRHLLSWAGYDVETATNGTAGIRAAQHRPPNLVLVDLLMPGMDGGTVLERLRADESTHDLPVVALTGVPEWLQDHRAAIFDGVVLKPAIGGELLREVRRLLNVESPPPPAGY